MLLPSFSGVREREKSGPGPLDFRECRLTADRENPDGQALKRAQRRKSDRCRSGAARIAYPAPAPGKANCSSMDISQNVEATS